VSERPPIPLVELVRHYREFKSRRDANGHLVPGPYRSQADRVRLAEGYLDDTERLVGSSVRSDYAFSSYRNIGESFIGTKRTCPAEVTGIDQIVNGPTAGWTFSYSFSSWARARGRKHTEPSSSDSPASFVLVSTRASPPLRRACRPRLRHAAPGPASVRQVEALARTADIGGEAESAAELQPDRYSAPRRRRSRHVFARAGP
jgi:hypothetical protein